MDTRKKLAIFKKSVRGLLKQNKQSLCDGDCVYLNPEGLKCAIGMLITEGSYNPKMEHSGPGDDRVQKALEKSGIIVSNESDVGFLTRLQNIHDGYEPCTWVDIFAYFARVEFSMSMVEAKKFVKSLKPKSKSKPKSKGKK